MNRQDEKTALRRAVRARSGGLEALRRESGQICRHLMAWPVYQRAATVALYMPLNHEADIRPVIADALSRRRRVCLPLVEGERMSFRLIRSLSELVPGSFGLSEPAAAAPLVPENSIDLMIVPLETADLRGGRLGKGGGYYDRLLAGQRPGMTCGAALSWQLTEQVPTDEWDIPLNALCSPEGLFICTSSVRGIQNRTAPVGEGQSAGDRKSEYQQNSAGEGQPSRL